MHNKPILRSIRRTASRTPTTTVTPSVTNLDAIRSALLDAVNKERRAAGLAPVAYNTVLEKSAQGHAQDMERREYFSHDSKEGSKPIDRMRKAGYLNIDITNCNCRSYTTSVGENIAKGQDTVAEVMEDWMTSKGHRENILSPKYKELGIGLSGEYWVQNFGGIIVK